jgi:D-beta-D-heptose 7-phosphate kinase / D-beta-D-heptose 1-phosphate adenosyltransferase
MNRRTNSDGPARAGGPIVVVGDALLDVDVDAVATRLAPDSTGPVLTERGRVERAGGAGLAAVLAAAGTAREVVLVTPICADEEGARLRALLSGVRVLNLPTPGATTVKTRLRAGGHTVARLDGGGGQAVARVPADVADVLRQAAAVLVSDYGLGTSGHAALRGMIQQAAGRCPVVWDPHPRGAVPVPGATLVTPNAAEAAAAAADPAGRGLAADTARADMLRRQWQAQAVAITRGAAGAVISLADGTAMACPAPYRSYGDTCGAGDTFAATACIALADGALPSEAIVAAVAAATRFVDRGGLTGAATPAEPAGPLSAEAGGMVARVRAAGGVVVATGGCFDLLHAGHLATLTAARELGDCLVVCLNSDESVRRLKGPGRPLQPEQDRVRVLRALRVVDDVVVFDEDTPEQVLRRIRPDIWVKGGDYDAGALPEATVLEEWGGTALTVPYVTGRSTSQLVQAARS